LRQVEELAATVSGRARLLSGSLLEEVVNITEWPHAVIGEFAGDYLKLPDQLLETIMVHHQRYFPVERKDASKKESSISSDNIMPYFVAVANNDLEPAQRHIKMGNERVLRARLADGKFFYFDDQKRKLTERMDELEQLTFQKGLGSYKDKVERLKKLSEKVSRELSLPAETSVCLERAVELCKLDLVTNLVGELPELQGYVGSWYAELEGEPPQVVSAIASHYAPRHPEEPIPADEIGCLAAALDKIDHLSGLFALGKKPSGSRDPFALRRNAQGLIDIAVDGLKAHPLNLTELFDYLLDHFEPVMTGGKKKLDRQEVGKQLHDFVVQRLRGKLLDMKFAREIVDSVLGARDPLTDVADVVTRSRCLEELVKADQDMKLIRAGVRVGNILKPDSPEEVNESDFSEPMEKELWTAFKEFRSRWQSNGFRAPQTEDEYKDLTKELTPLAPSIDKFFEDVMVNDEDKKKRNVRHAILKNIDEYFKTIADFHKLQPLLP